MIRFLIIPLIIFRKLIWPPIWRIIDFILLRKALFFWIFLGIGVWWGFMSWMASGVQEVENMEPVATPGPLERESVTELPEIKGKIEDGNSAFSKNILRKMPKEDMALYSREFYYAMHYAKADEPYLWKKPDETMFGKITVGAPYKSSKGVFCRNLDEIISYKGHAQRFNGKACQRTTDNGWCKLRKKSTSSCELKYSPGMWENVKNWFKF